jgi:hypothetical protein
MNKVFKFFKYIVILFFILYLLFVLWMPITGRGYDIPKESSVFTFSPLCMNAGSGEWWVYGEDNKNYYVITDNMSPPYLVYPKIKASACHGFNKTRVKTWCGISGEFDLLEANRIDFPLDCDHTN